MRPVTWVKIEEVPEGQWDIAGNAMTAAMVHQLQKGETACSSNQTSSPRMPARPGGNCVMTAA